jgi:hypothetical protein
MPNREVVFRVGVVRGVRAKLCAKYLGYRGVPPDSCSLFAPPLAPWSCPGVPVGVPVGVPAGVLAGVLAVVPVGVPACVPAGVPAGVPPLPWCPGE